MSRKRHLHHHRHRRRGARNDPDPREELYGFLDQSNISALNLKRIKHHLQSEDAQTRALAEVLFEIARVHPGPRKRLGHLARLHWTLFVRMVEVLPNSWWDRFLPGEPTDEAPNGWLYDRVSKARFEIWWRSHGANPCHCGSGELYRNCCARRDELSAQQWAEEEREREERSDPYPFPWWHPESTVDPMTRCGYEAYYALGEDHPLAIDPDSSIWECECHNPEVVKGKRRKKIQN